MDEDKVMGALMANAIMRAEQERKTEADLVEAADMLHMQYETFKKAGFTAKQSFELVKLVLETATITAFKK